MKIRLTPHETRVIGCLIEKEITTPDQYPLSLNALTNACNQKSNREPVLHLDEATVQDTIDALKKRFLVAAGGGFGSRVTKFQHRFCNAEFGELKLSAAEVAVICELLLRGPQTPGELRTRGERLHKFAGLEEVEAALKHLMERDEPMVAKLPREPGKRESRFMHLLSGDAPPPSATAEPEDEPMASGSERERLERLEGMVENLTSEVERLKEKLAEIGGKGSGI